MQDILMQGITLPVGLAKETDLPSMQQESEFASPLKEKKSGIRTKSKGIC